VLPVKIRVQNLSSRLLFLRNKVIQKHAAPPLVFIARRWRGVSCVGHKILCRPQDGWQDGDQIAQRWHGEAWDLLALLQWITQLNDERPLSAGIFSWQPSPHHFLAFAISCECAMWQPFWWMIHWVTLTWSSILHKRQRLNRTVSAWIRASLVKPLIAGDTTDFHFFLPKSENAVFKYRLVASFDISVFGLLAEWDRRLLEYERLAVRHTTGHIAARNFCSGALLRQASHRVVSDPWTCQIQNRIAEMKKAKRLRLLRRVCKTELLKWKGQATSVAPKRYRQSQHFRMTCAMTCRCRLRSYEICIQATFSRWLHLLTRNTVEVYLYVIICKAFLITYNYI